MAAYWHARMVSHACIHSCSALAKRFETWTYDDDRRLAHLYSYWKSACNDFVRLTFRFGEPVASFEKAKKVRSWRAMQTAFENNSLKI